MVMITFASLILAMSSSRKPHAFRNSIRPLGTFQEEVFESFQLVRFWVPSVPVMTKRFS